MSNLILMGKLKSLSIAKFLWKEGNLNVVHFFSSSNYNIFYICMYVYMFVLKIHYLKVQVP